MRLSIFIGMSLVTLGSMIFPANASLLISASIGTLPFGPFTPTEPIVISGSIANVSTQDATICEGVCTGVTYSLGGFASSPIGYTFIFGDGADPGAGFLSGQANGLLSPGQEKDFVFGEYIPDGGDAALGGYNFFVQLQIFAATSDRPMVGSAAFGGTWQVEPALESVPEPSSLALLSFGLFCFGIFKPRVS